MSNAALQEKYNCSKGWLSCRQKSSARHVGVHPYKHQYTRVPPKKTATSKLPVEHSSIPWVVSTHLKTMLVKLDHFLKERGENINVWNQHLDSTVGCFVSISSCLLAIINLPIVHQLHLSRTVPWNTRCRFRLKPDRSTGSGQFEVAHSSIRKWPFLPRMQNLQWVCTWEKQRCKVSGLKKTSENHWDLGFCLKICDVWSDPVLFQFWKFNPDR